MNYIIRELNKTEVILLGQSPHDKCLVAEVDEKL